MRLVVSEVMMGESRMDVDVVEEGVTDAMPAEGSACCIEKLVWTWLGRPRRR